MSKGSCLVLYVLPNLLLLLMSIQGKWDGSHYFRLVEKKLHDHEQLASQWRRAAPLILGVNAVNQEHAGYQGNYRICSRVQAMG